MINENFVILGALISFSGSLSYLLDTLKGKVKPNRVSYFMWSLAPLVAFFAQIQSGVGIGALMTLTVGLSPLSIFIASFFNKKSLWKITTFDLICGALSFIGFLIYLITKDAVLAVSISIIADGLASLPTIRKSFTNPETESSAPYFTSSISAIITLLSLKSFAFMFSAFPIYILIVCLLIFTLVQFRLGLLIFSKVSAKISK